MQVTLGWAAIDKKTKRPHTGGQYRAGTKLYTSEAVARHAMWARGESNYTYHEVAIELGEESCSGKE